MHRANAEVRIRLQDKCKCCCCVQVWRELTSGGDNFTLVRQWSWIPNVIDQREDVSAPKLMTSLDTSQPPKSNICASPASSDLPPHSKLEQLYSGATGRPTRHLRAEPQPDRVPRGQQQRKHAHSPGRRTAARGTGRRVQTTQVALRVLGCSVDRPQ